MKYNINAFLKEINETLDFSLMNETYKKRIEFQIKFMTEGWCENCGRCCEELSPIELYSQDLYKLAEAVAGHEITDKEEMKKFLKIAYKRHVKHYPKSKDQYRTCMKKDKPCKFRDIEGKKCNIYENRPIVCQRYPFLSGEPADSNTFIVPDSCPGAVKMYEELKKMGEIE